MAAASACCCRPFYWDVLDRAPDSSAAGFAALAESTNYYTLYGGTTAGFLNGLYVDALARPNSEGAWIDLVNRLIQDRLLTRPHASPAASWILRW
jgi:hypothetical protein